MPCVNPRPRVKRGSGADVQSLAKKSSGFLKFFLGWHKGTTDEAASWVAV